jgi:hypothetical protein
MLSPNDPRRVDMRQWYFRTIPAPPPVFGARRCGRSLRMTSLIHVKNGSGAWRKNASASLIER